MIYLNWWWNIWAIQNKEEAEWILCHIRKPIFSCISSNQGFKNSTIRIIAICMAAVNAIQIKVHLQHSSGDKVLRKNLGSSNAPILIIVSSPCIAIISYCYIVYKIRSWKEISVANTLSSHYYQIFRQIENWSGLQNFCTP